jgi:hypothetical protein
VLSTTSKSSGTAYVEFRIDGLTTTNFVIFGFAQNNQDVNQYLTFAGDAGFVRADATVPGGSGAVTVNPANVPTYTGVVGSIIAIAFDFDAGKAWVAHNDSWGGDPGAGTNPAFTWTPGGDWFFGWGASSESGSGQATTVRTTTVAQTYTPPTGFSRWDP